MISFVVNFDILAKKLSPISKRGAKSLAWLYSLIEPMNTINNDFFVLFYGDLVDQAKRTGQKIVLEDTLNNLFDPERRIYIDNSGDDIASTYIYNFSEGYEPFFVKTEAEGEYRYLFNHTEESEGGGFVVYVPWQVFNNFEPNLVIAKIEQYRPAGTTYTMTTI